MQIKLVDGTDESSDEDQIHQAPDLEYVNELLEHIERDPSAGQTHLLLMQHYDACGWYEAAEEQARKALQLDVSVIEAHAYIESRDRKAKFQSEKRSKNKNEAGLKSKGKRRSDAHSHEYQVETWRPKLLHIQSKEKSLKELEEGYSTMFEDAESLLADMKLLSDSHGLVREREMLDVYQLTKGRVSSLLRPKPMASIHTVGEAVTENGAFGQKDNLEMILQDFKDFALWFRRSDDAETSNDSGDLRQALLQRSNALKSALPHSLKPLAQSAMMHAEREILQRKYVNNTTMILEDPISEIPRHNFWSSEDGYAWDMEELAGAIKSTDGVMRNPLSKQMLTENDIRAIIKHPLGRHLQALQIEQSKLKRGVRGQTIEELDKLSKVLLVDLTEDARPSHLATEVFVSYLETLPDNERQTIDKLKVPARDSHTGISFDTTIREAVDDLRGNRVCSHKTGDFFAQAANFLRNSVEGS